MPHASKIVPAVAVQPVGAAVLHCLLVFWATAREDAHIFDRLRADLEEGFVFELYAHPELALAIYTLQPTQASYSPPSLPSGWLVYTVVSSLLRFFVMAALRVRFDYVLNCFSSLRSVARLARLRVAHPVDAYTLEVLQGLWNLAVDHPGCLDGLVEGDCPKDPRLAWSIWKLQKDNVSRSRGRALSPVRALNDDTLRLIFTNLRDASPLYSTYPGEIHSFDVASHLPARAVCTHWRTLIHSMPFIWSPMTMGFGLRITKLALHYSQGTALDVDLSYDRSQTVITRSAMLNLAEMGRIRTLSVNVSRSVLEVISPLITSSETPFLQSLKMWPHGDDRGTLPLTLDELSFGGISPPLLREAILFNCAITPTCPLFRSPLVVLKLDICSAWDSLDSLIATLQGLPNLETFHWGMSRSGIFAYSLPIEFPQAAFLHSSRTPANLPHLERLSLECPTVCFAAIMAHVQIPASCSLDLLDDYTFSDDSVAYEIVAENILHLLDSSIGHNLLRWTTADPQNNFDCVDVFEFPEAEAGQGALLIEGRQSDRSWGTRISVALTVAADADGNIGTDVLSTLLRGILSWPALRSADAVVTNHEAMSNENLWAVVLGGLPSAVSLRIENSADSDASGAVGGLARAMLHNGDLAPLLSHLTLGHLSLSLELQQIIATALEMRYRQRRPAVSLDLVYCEGVGEDDIAFMQEVIRRCGGDLQVVAR